ncbi:MAG TPA: hypothetical protein VLA84_16890 [Microcoleus sp.]|nr:hypothetical protein [Microcoleus sp.]
MTIITVSVFMRVVLLDDSAVETALQACVAPEFILANSLQRLNFRPA